MTVHAVDQRYIGNGVQLAWGIVNDELVSVSAYVGVPPGRRPLALCPVCSGRVRFNLGPQKAHHFSHVPGADCAVQSGETAAHLNTKFHIAAELRRASRLVVREKCRGSSEFSNCSDTWLVTLAEGWDAVHVERGLGSLRPDILLTQHGVAVAAIEVYATHAVPPEKAEALGALGLPWIEVGAEEALFASNGPWTADIPLPALRREPASTWRCPMCTHALHERERQRLEQERNAAYQARLHRKYGIVIDVYRSGGRHFREVIWTIAEMDGEQIVSVQLWKERLNQVMARVKIRDNDLHTPRRTLGRKLRRWVEYHEQRGALVDQVTGWMPANRLREFKDLRSAYPRRYLYDAAKGWQRREPERPRSASTMISLLASHGARHSGR